MAETCEVSCIEVCAAGRLVGYAIFFSGGWDAYIRDGRMSMLCVGTNYVSADLAVRAVREGFDWRKKR